MRAGAHVGALASIVALAPLDVSSHRIFQVLAGWILLAGLARLMAGIVEVGRRARTKVAARVVTAGTGESDREADREVDPVTGLLQYEPVDAIILGPSTAAVLMVEVDSYLMTTHIVGVEAGQVLLTEAAERVCRVAAELGGQVRRMSGPHLVLLVPAADEGELQDAASHLALVNDRRAVTDVGALTVGIAVAPRDGADVPTLIRAAMVAVAYGRREHAGTAVFYEPEMAEDTWDRFTVGRALRTAIDRREISLAYQPQLDLATGAVVGVEVLARWTDGVLGPISPARFVRVADQLGMGRALDRLVFQQALQQLRIWDDAGVHLPRMSVNVSPDTLRASGIATMVDEMLRRYQIAPHRITVELIESRLLEADAGLDTLRQLRDLGLRVSLDDFGTGYASFSQLVTLPIDELKIDRSFLSDSDDPVTSGAVVAAIVRVGQTLGLDVVAEGIERVDHQELLRKLRCPAGQGYLYSPPLTADELVAWMVRREGSSTLLPGEPARSAPS